ncbi:MAG: ABC transporter substrate-binding protein [Ruminococcus sp.]|nr:ABC transporter substrate-binding protein [Ruminococcus sp.]
MRKRKRIVALALVLCLMCTLFCSCATDDENASGGTKARVYYLNFKPEQSEDWEKLATTYFEQTGVEVSVVTAASDTYESTLKSEMVKTDAPTLFQVNGPVGLKNWKDCCYDLSKSTLYANLKSDDFALKGEGSQVLAIAYAIETYGIIYNKELLNNYIETDKAVISSPEEINNFETLKAVAEDIQSKREELGIKGAFTSAGMDASSDWRFKTHLANVPIYYEYLDEGVKSSDAIKGTYLENYKNIWDLYINNSTVEPSQLLSKTDEDAVSEFALGEAVFYQNGTWIYDDIKGYEVDDEDIGILPIYIGVEGEENQGLCTGSENYWCVNKNASSEDIEATLTFLDWVITSEQGKTAISQDMGFVTPFSTFTDEYVADNPLLKAANDYIAQGKTPVAWTFTTMPSEQWKDDVGSALLKYAQGTQEWSAVEDAFVGGWATQFRKAKGE